MKVSIVGGSGYAGGESLRLLLGHPKVTLGQVTSESNAGKYVHSVHPNLRKRTDLKFVSALDLEPCEVLFVALPHGSSMKRMPEFLSVAERVIDLGADFRLRDPADYPKWYGAPHARPDLLGQAVYGIPELHREAIKSARIITGAGCNATTTILGLLPLFKHGLADPSRVVVEVKVGSSEAGAKASDSSHHPERSHAVRSFQPTMHRHTAEVMQELTFGGQTPKVYFSATAVELVRGILATCHVFLKDNLAEKDIWRVYRQEYGQEPFLRIVKDRTGIYRYPEPKILAGSNFCDVGFERDEGSDRLVVMAALDNLMKGAAGNGVQAMNVACGFEETLGLEFLGLHPI
ncbi:MAG: N-acetyl-gamma-glutamyl-phosphate reductase [Chloroflexi bacterium]|nr:N-acetyl-gamma-glutamyl-phosphate reductase [Chloroflexota bacterium]MCL5108312.1 N-acetyl-gamma-glutamyl-phosphate reductase [Chloroflexota bacterium]MDA8218270.1 N-acetyl-gamma-glutamyl-phosphate reductase [Dehalococcoidales bacterium]